VKAHADQADVDRKHCPEHRVDVLELLADEAEGQVIQPVTAVALGEADARKAQGCQLGEDLRVVAAGAVVGLDPRRELPRTKIPDRGDQLLLVGAQRQVEHRYAELTWTAWRSVWAKA